MSKERNELLRELAEESRRSTLDSVYFLQAVAERSGMNLTDLQCIAILISTGPITAGQLAETTGLTTGAVTGVIDRMERAGYVRREKDPGDGRRVVVQPVLEALEQAGAGLFGPQEGQLDALMSEYDDRDLAIFLDLMRKANTVTREEIDRIRAAAGDKEGENPPPLGSVERGRLVFVNGTTRLTLRVASAMDTLYQANFEGTAPKVEFEAGTVTVRRSRRFTLFDLRKHAETFTLNPAVPWEIEVRGGAARLEANLEGLELSSFALKGGIGDVVLKLPEPLGTVKVRLTGGMAKASFYRPAGVEVQLNARGGFSKLAFDEQNLHGGGGKVQLQSPGYREANNRYDIEISGGASEIAVQ